MTIKNIVHVTKFTNKLGEEKKSYQTVGKLFIYPDGGMTIKMEYTPVGGNGNYSVYDPKTKEVEKEVGKPEFPKQQIEIPF